MFACAVTIDTNITTVRNYVNIIKLNILNHKMLNFKHLFRGQVALHIFPFQLLSLFKIPLIF